MDTIEPNFPPGVLQADPRFTQQYFNLSPQQSFSGTWNTGEIPGMEKDWQLIEDPISFVKETEGLTNLPDRKAEELEQTEAMNVKMSREKSAEVKSSEPVGIAQWSEYEKEA